MKKRILSILLLGAMMLSLAACSKNKEKTDVTTDNQAADVTIAGIEKKNYDKDITILYHDTGSSYFSYFFVEENTGEAMDVAVYNRETKIEDHLGINIIWTIAESGGDQSINAVYPSLQQMAMTGDDLYQIVFTHCIQDTAVMITDGLLADLNDVSTINFDNDWWNKRSNENLSVADRQFYALSDFNIPEVNAVLFNKTIVETSQIENPYDLVREGKWTLDKMYELSDAMYVDSNDNGRRDINDMFGFGAPSEHMLTAFTYSCGLTLVEKDEDGYFQFALNTEDAYTFVEKLTTLFRSKGTWHYDWFHDSIGGAGMGGTPEKSLNITTGRCLFALKSLASLDEYRETTVDFGILPYPKFDEAQEDYLSLDWAALTCMPLVANNKDIAGEVLELYACLASEEVLPAYYDIVLGQKLSRDEDSREMLDIIFDGVIFDAGMNYFGFTPSMRHFWSLPNSVATYEVTGYASFLERYEEAVIATLDDFNYDVEVLD